MSRPKLVLALIALAVFAVHLSSGPPVGSTPGGHGPFVPGEIIVKFKAGAHGPDKTAVQAALDAYTVKTFHSTAEHWSLGSGVDVLDAVQQLSANPLVEYAEPNYILTADVIPDDEHFDELWNMYNVGQTGGTTDADIDAEMAWGVSTGSANVLVGVIDTGVDYTHPDLAANIWTNPGEIPDNGVDDDSNGFVDDIHGWDFYNDDNDPWDDNGHGTHVSGTIGAVGDNGIGVAGVNWTVRIMGIKFLSSGGTGSTAGAISSVDYATMMGVDLTSNSWGGGSFSQALYDAIAAAGAADMLFVAAAGNAGTNTDTSPHYPSSYTLDNIISVAMTDHNDAYDSLSNYGAVSVDLAAPGSDVLSTLPGNSYGYGSGTSMATPHVSGVAALIRALSPGVPSSQIKNIILASVDDITDPSRPTLTNGRLNAFFAIAEPDDDPPAPILDLAAGNPTSNTMELTWTATGDDGTDGQATFYEVRYSTAPINEDNWADADLAPNAPPPAPSGTPESMEVAGLVADTMYYFAIKAFDEWANGSDLGPNGQGMTLLAPQATLAPTSLSADLFTGESDDQIVTLANVGPDSTLDFYIPTPAIGEPMAAQAALILGKDDPDPRSNDPVILGLGGPDAGGYRWIDSDEPGGPTFNWIDISQTGTVVGPLTDDSISDPFALGFDFPFYGEFFDSVRIASNGFLSFTHGGSPYNNQPLPNNSAPENLVAAFWDDLNPALGGIIYFQAFSGYVVVQYDNIQHYASTGPGTYTFQVIMDSSGAITYQYLSLEGVLNSCTIGIQDSTQSIGLQVAFNQDYLHENLAVRISTIPQWLSAAPTSGRLYSDESADVGVHIDASGLEGGVYPGEIHVLTNDPANPDMVVDVTLTVTGAPDAVVSPDALHYGDRYQGIPHELVLTVRNAGTDTLHVTNISTVEHVATDLITDPTSFDLAPRASQDVVVTWTPSGLGEFSGSIHIFSDDAGEPEIVVPVTGNSVTAPQVVLNPESLEDTLYTGQTSVHTLSVTNAGGSPLEIYQAAADLGDGRGPVVAPEIGTDGAGGPDAFGYSWIDSDEPGGPTFDWIDISGTGTQVSFPSNDDGLSGAIPMGMTFPFYGNDFTELKVSTNGWLTFDTSETSSRPYNYELPTTSASPNMIAMFWDDLHLRSTGTVHYLNDGNRFILQFTDVERYSTYSPGLFTFQVQLYQNGKTLLQYLSVEGYLVSSTIGLQDETETIGMSMAYNEAYVHDNLAIQIGTTPDWMSVTPSSATVPAGETFDFQVAFDATDRVGGDYVGAVVLDTNIGEYQAPATLHVIGVPVVQIIPESYDYGTKYVGYSHLTNFRVVNTGTDVLNVSDVVTTDPTLVIGESQNAGFQLPPGGGRLFTLAWQPVTDGALNAAIQVISDDPVNPTLSMPVTGNAVWPPIAAWAPDSYTEDLLVGDVVTRQLHLENNGGSDLQYTVALQDLSSVQVTVYPELKLGKDEPDPRPGILGSGGPDNFGYKWRDSDEPGGPIPVWTDISGIGTQIEIGTYNPGYCDDCNVGPFPIGFDFPFYGNTFDSFRVSTNGFVSFTSTVTDYSNDPLPSSGGPENLLAVFWDDLVHRNGTGSEPLASGIYYYFDGARLIIQYQHMYRIGSYADDLNFQIMLYPSGKVVYQYGTLSTTTMDSNTVGIQNDTRDDGLTVVYDDIYLQDNMAVQFSTLDWLSVVPLSGAVPPGQAVDLDVTIDTTPLIGGDYAASVDLITNDPMNAYIQVPVYLHTTGIPDIDADPTSLAFPTTFVGFSSSLPLTIQNVGTDLLTITDFELTGDFAQSGLTVPVNLPPAGTIPLTVDFVPTAAGALTGTLTLVSDDPDEPSFVIDLSGDALIPPEIGTTPDAITALVPLGESVTETLTIHNTGGSDLNWDGAASFISARGPVTVYPDLELAKGEVDPRPGILGSGGPDLFGYTWKDSDEPGGPVFNWVDISSIGTPIAGLDGDDENRGPVPIGFDFPFYGNTFNEVRACTNGWLSFTSTSTDLSNGPLPGTSAPENLLAVFHDDLHFRYEERATYYNDGSRFIVQYTGVDRYSPSGESYTFQVILYPNGRIVYQYLSMTTARLDDATIGIQNADRTDGLTVVYNADYVHDGLAIEFKAGAEWMSLDPSSGTIAAGESQDVTVTLDASEIGVGLHEATIDLTSNDPYTTMYQVPVTIDVNARPVAVCADKVVPENGVDCTSSASVDDGSYDPEGGPLSYVEEPPAPYGLGEHTVTLTVTDEVGLSASCTATLTVIDATPPALSVAMNPDLLWPAHGQLVDVYSSVVSTDACSEPDVVMESCVSDEWENDPADDNGRGQSDIFGVEVGTPDWNMQFRAERSLDGDGRVYTTTYRATDAAGNVSIVEGYVVVPLMYKYDISDVRLDPVPGLGTRVSWGEVGVAVSYDVVRGDLSSLQDRGEEIDLGAVVCIEANSADATTEGFEDAEIPAPGEVFFYVVEYFDTEISYYGTASDGKPRSPSAGHCN